MEQNATEPVQGFFSRIAAGLRTAFTPPQQPVFEEGAITQGFARSQMTPEGKFNPVILPVRPESAGLEGLGEYTANVREFDFGTTSLFHPQPPTNVQFPRAIDSQNILASPPRFTSSAVYNVFSKPRKGTPGNNPMGVNTTQTA